MDWKVITLLLCTFGVLKEFRPSEPYLYQYEHVTLNISEEILNSEVYPIWTYSYLAALIPVFLLTDLLLYKPIIIAEALSFVIVWCLFVFGRSVTVQKVIEFFYGWATATEIAYFSYIYVKVDRAKFKRVTSLTRAAVQTGKCVAYILAQILILTDAADYYTLNVISLVSLVISLGFSISLPSVSWRTAYAKNLAIDVSPQKIEALTYLDYVKSHFKNWIKEIKIIYGDWFIVKWSLWWAMASCANFQIGNYTQTLWGSVAGHTHMYNAFTEAICPLISIPVVLLMERVTLDWKKYGELFLCLASLVDGAILFVLAKTYNIWVMYVGYIIYRVLYQGMITIAQFNIANRLQSESFGLVFGLNTFVALVMESILTLVVADEHGLALSIRPQFFVYSGFHGVISLIFVVPIVVAVIRYFRRRPSEEPA